MKESSGSQALSVQSLKSQIELPIGVPVLAGTIDLATEDASASETPWLAKLPLVGPFFRQKNGSRYHSRLIIITRLTQPTSGPPKSKQD
jgi:Flp pilus assembly secretin CpaC